MQHHAFSLAGTFFQLVSIFSIERFAGDQKRIVGMFLMISWPDVNELVEPLVRPEHSKIEK